MTDGVVVTGFGATTPLGGDAASTWEALLAGKSGVGATRADWVERFDLPVSISAQLAVEPTEILPRVQARRMDRCEQVAVVAAKEAWAHAGLGPVPGEDGAAVEAERLAVVIGAGIGGAPTLLAQDDLLEEHGLRKVSPLTVPMLMPNGPAALVSLEYKARAGCTPRLGVRHRRRGPGLGLQAAARRGGRRRPRGRRRVLHRADHRGRVRAVADAVHPQRRPGGRLPAVRHRAGRLRPR